MKPSRLLSALATSALTASVPTFASAASTVVLPASMCPNSDPIFADGFEATPAVPSQPSLGSGGAYPGNVTRSVSVGSLGSRNYYLHIPAGYTPTKAWPLLLVLRGSTQATLSAEDAAAQQVRANWASWSDSAGFIVVSVVGTSTQGGWGAANDGMEISLDLDDAIANYNVERSRIYLWGFSAGAHYGHSLALSNPNYFAAYGVSAGSLEQYACTDAGVPAQGIPKCATLLGSATPKIPVDIHLGTTDPLASPPYTAAGDPARFEANGWTLNRNLYYTLFAGGHTYTVAQLGEIWNHLCPFALAQ
jgi:predicted esterase